jgi:DNA ligase 1
MYNTLGDIGDVAMECRRSQRVLLPPPALTLSGVLSTLRAAARERGQGAAGRRKAAVKALLGAARESEPRWLARALVGAMRVGANWRSVVPALARALLIHERELERREGEGQEGCGLPSKVRH